MENVEKQVVKYTQNDTNTEHSSKLYGGYEMIVMTTDAHPYRSSNLYYR